MFKSLLTLWARQDSPPFEHGRTRHPTAESKMSFSKMDFSCFYCFHVKDSSKYTQNTEKKTWNKRERLLRKPCFSFWSDDFSQYQFSKKNNLFISFTVASSHNLHISVSTVWAWVLQHRINPWRSTMPGISAEASSALSVRISIWTSWFLSSLSENCVTTWSAASLVTRAPAQVALCLGNFLWASWQCFLQKNTM